MARWSTLAGVSLARPPLSRPALAGHPVGPKPSLASLGMEARAVESSLARAEAACSGREPASLAASSGGQSRWPFFPGPSASPALGWQGRVSSSSRQAAAGSSSPGKPASPAPDMLEILVPIYLILFQYEIKLLLDCWASLL